MGGNAALLSALALGPVVIIILLGLGVGVGGNVSPVSALALVPMLSVILIRGEGVSLLILSVAAEALVPVAVGIRGPLRAVRVSERLAVGKTAELTDSGGHAGRFLPGVLTDLRAYRNRHISGHTFNHDGIDLASVLKPGANDRRAFSNLESVFNAYYELKDSVVTVLCREGVAEEELAVLIGSLYGNGVADVRQGHITAASVAKTVNVVVSVRAVIRLRAALTFTEVN